MKAVFNNRNINIAGYDYFVYNSLEIIFGGYGEKLTARFGSHGAGRRLRLGWATR